MQTAWFSTQEWLAQNKDVARRFAMRSSPVARGHEQSDAASVILAKWTGSKEAMPKIRFASKLDPAQIQPVYDSGFRYKLLTANRSRDFSWNGK